MMSMENLRFDERACFIAGAAKSGTTLLVSLLDSHPELLVMPQDTAYFPTVLTKYRNRGRQAQFDYLTKESWTNVLFGFQAMRGRQDYAEFPKKKIRNKEIPGLVVGYEDLALDPKMSMQKVCDYLEINFDPEIVLNPTKVGRSWAGNSAAGVRFAEISTAPVTRWKNELHEGEVGWVEWHCRDLMPEFGYEPRLTRRSLRYFMKPIRGERPKEFFKSRAYSLRDRLKGLFAQIALQG